MTTPESFLTVHLRSPATDVGLTGLCVGYEDQKWRAGDLARHLMEWLPDFALSHADRESVGVHNMIDLARKAAKTVYLSDKYGRRGEFGELLLHVAVRQVFGSLPAISKIYYKDSPNDTVKGFDAVHVVEAGDDLELWLGEAKLYTDIDAAIRDVCKELIRHTHRDYLRTEFLLIGNKIDPRWKNAAALKRLIHQNTSLDTVFARTRIPVLLTFNSEVSASSVCCDNQHIMRFTSEVSAAYAKFKASAGPLPIHVELILLPLKDKDELVKLLDEELRRWQSL